MLTARVFEEPTGYFVCNNAYKGLDARGRAYPSKAAALRAAADYGYTHATGSGTYWGTAVRSIKRWQS